MGLNIVTQGGDFDPYVKYNAKSGRWYFKDGENEVEVQDPSFVADFDNIKTGWMCFMEGQAPDKVFDADLSTPAARPLLPNGDSNHKRGFVLRLFSSKFFKGVVELSATSMHVCNAINDLYDVYEAEKAANAGKLPVVTANGTTASKDKFGTNYKPNLSITSWVDRPVDFDQKQPQSDEIPAFDPNPKPAASASEF